MTEEEKQVRVERLCAHLKIVGLEHMSPYVKTCAQEGTDQEFEAIASLLERAADKKSNVHSARGCKAATIRKKLASLKGADNKYRGRHLNLIIRSWTADGTGVGVDSLYEQLDEAIGVKSEEKG